MRRTVDSYDWWGTAMLLLSLLIMLLSSDVAAFGVVCVMVFCYDVLFGPVLLLYMRWACGAAGAFGGGGDDGWGDKKILLCVFNLENCDGGKKVIL